jgi:hypothetical protein
MVLLGMHSTTLTRQLHSEGGDHYNQTRCSLLSKTPTPLLVTTIPAFVSRPAPADSEVLELPPLRTFVKFGLACMSEAVLFRT